MTDIYDAVDRAKEKSLWRQLVDEREKNLRLEDELEWLRGQADQLLADNRRLQAQVDFLSSNR